MKKVRRKKIKVLKKWIRVAILLWIFVLVGLATYLIFSGFSPSIYDKHYYNYDVRRKVDYVVYLKPNKLYQQNFLPSGQMYPSALIDYIDVTFWFNYGDSKETDYEYNYEIKAKLIGEYNDSISGKQEIWTKDYVFVDETSKETTGTEINLNKKIRIYYDDYNSLVNEFKSNYKLSIDAYLLITAKVNYKSKLSVTSIKGDDDLIIKIPLSKPAINIDTKYDDDFSDSLYERSIKFNYVKIYVGFILAVAVFIAFFNVKGIIFVNSKSAYHKILEKYLKDYGDIIVETSTTIDLTDLTVYDINNFDDMVDVEEELKSPIMLYEEIPGKLCQFVIIKNSYAYRYVLDIKNLK